MTNTGVCVEVDQCQNEPCDQNATCVSKPGNFSCACRIGYSGDGVSCTRTGTVLVLNSRGGNAPLLVDAKGRNDRNRIMSFGYDTEVHFSCSITFRNRFYVFGGKKHKRQISEVAKCVLRRVGNLGFDHYNAACSNVNDQELYLCFDENDSKQCWSAVHPLGNFTKVPPSTHYHELAKTAASPSKFRVIYSFFITISRVTRSWWIWRR